MRFDGKYRVQTRNSGERGWRTEAVIEQLEPAMREARRVTELRTWGQFRQYQYVQVVHEGQAIAAWTLGRPVLPARLRPTVEGGAL